MSGFFDDGLSSLILDGLCVVLLMPLNVTAHVSTLLVAAVIVPATVATVIVVSHDERVDGDLAVLRLRNVSYTVVLF